MVYFIQSGDNGPIKIGSTDNLSARIATLQAANPYQLNLIGILEGGQAEEYELHKRLAKYRVTGEWFSPTDEVLHLVKHLDDAKVLRTYLGEAVKSIKSRLDKARPLSDISIDLHKEIEKIECDLVTIALERCDFVQTYAAKLLGLGKSNLNQKIKKYKIAFKR